MNKNLVSDFEEILCSGLPFDELKNSTILITGSTGFVGSYLVKALLYINQKLDLNMSVLAMIRNQEKANKIFADYRSNYALEYVVMDLLNDGIVLEDSVDYIIHTAAITKSRAMIDKPVETIHTAINGTNTLLKYAAIHKPKSFVYISSMEAYGTFNNNGELVTEDKLGYINPLLVRSCYPESKRLCENLCVAYKNEYSVPVKIARLSQTFGAGILQTENRVFAQFAKSAIEGKSIVLHTKGLSEGNYTYISETIEALLTILLKGEDGNAYNIANEECHTTIAGMAKMVANEVAKGAIDVVFDIPDNNIFGYATDTRMKLSSKKLRELGWSPKVGLKEAYMRMIDYMKEEFE